MEDNVSRVSWLKPPGGLQMIKQNTLLSYTVSQTKIADCPRDLVYIFNTLGCLSNQIMRHIEIKRAWFSSLPLIKPVNKGFLMEPSKSMNFIKSLYKWGSLSELKFKSNNSDRIYSGSYFLLNLKLVTSWYKQNLL